MKPAGEEAMAACEDDADVLHEALGVSVTLAGALEEEVLGVSVVLAGEVVDGGVVGGGASSHVLAVQASEPVR